MQDPELWARIEDYDFPRGFEDKLAQLVGGWQGPMRRVREEYRRFVYLALISEGEATPSETVDRVWHLHLSYSRDYWENFCPKVLRQDFHHDPCEQEAAMPRYRAQYATTLALYQQEFGDQPPLKVWPTSVLTKRFWSGVGVAFMGVCIGGLAMFAGQGESVWANGAALLLLVVGLAYSIFNMPYGQTGRTAGGCGGSSAGCGGGGCGGGG